MEKATFAAGCFWGVEEAFRRLPGVVATTAGYVGGWLANPSYKQVCTGRTGHAEAVQVEFDPTQITYDQLLNVFWNIHDPTTINRQGPDIGTQYRSAIFYHSPAQKAAAIESKKRLNDVGKLPGPIVTQIVPMKDFWPAEEYHQQYIQKQGLTGCHLDRQ